MGEKLESKRGTGIQNKDVEWKELVLSCSHVFSIGRCTCYHRAVLFN